ncbi:MAG: hypothetical protein WDO18_05545 [Acidobacteriota bacterium]
MKRLLGLLVLSAGAMFAQNPVVTQILNNYGLEPLAASQNSGIAQGSIFIVKGTNLSDQTTGLQDTYPLVTTLRGVRMQITVGATTTFAYFYYVLPGQLAGILPSNTPVGTGTLVVQNNGKSSAPATIKVVRSAFGTLAVSGAGSGMAAVHDSNYNLLSATNATNPSKYLVFYGSGAGPTTKDESVLQTGANASGDFTNIPITVTIGGKAATVLYHARTQYPGLDQINVQVPALDANTYSCAVAVIITLDGVVSNATTIPVAASGSTCTNPSTGGGGTTFNGLSQTDIDAIVSRGAFKFGSIDISRSTTYSSGFGQPETMTKSDEGSASFFSITGLDLRNMLTQTSVIAGYVTPAPGVCNVFNTQAILDAYPNITYASLDAGPSVTLRGPAGGSRVMTKETNAGFISYSATLGNATAGNFLDAGTYTAAGTGGPGVGAFSISVPMAPEITWTNRTALATVTRSSGMTVNWTGGEPTGLVTVTGTSIDTLTASAGIFQCYARGSAGTLTVPASVLTRIPASTSISGFSIPGTVDVSSDGQTAQTTASGVDFLFFSSSTSVSSNVTFR